MFLAFTSWTGDDGAVSGVKTNARTVEKLGFLLHAKVGVRRATTVEVYAAFSDKCGGWLAGPQVGTLKWDGNGQLPVFTQAAQ